MRGHSQSIYAKKKEKEPTLLDQFEAKAVLNVSGLGRSFLAQKKDTKELFVIKEYNKDVLVD